MNAWSVHFKNPVPYQQGLEIQRRLLKARQENEIPDTVLILQHNPVVTLGNRGRANYLLKTEEEYRELGIELFHAERGGDVTFHGPGQWVLYPILYLGGNEADSHGYLSNLEEVAIQTLADYGVKGFRREGKSGAWTDAGKIAAIGFRLKKWVSFHGMSFNVSNNLMGFNTIVPCGLVGEPVASLKTILGEDCPEMPAVCDSLLNHFSTVCNRKLERFDADGELPPALAKLVRDD
ncbi:lipoyl(octanoyl) transferase LipB [Pontiella sulfatireligans]|uniref:Octanoyltransferase n=1 Tax=Pontiella sulfatireligans TaxID=2750658 RepID=A0A6C2UUP4_9BACT|nr:lipoyl(octanoyl) transferase LipB [Pontiella sulfatireligans]VGO23091.1 Octanoyltransferase [Pontiella sulfatireligans]